MSLPQITSYPMPAPEELPSNKVSWTVDPARAALLIHDMQQYFLRAYDRNSAPVPELLHNISELRTAADQHRMPVIFTAQPGNQTRQQRGLLQEFWGDGVGGGQEPDIVAELRPGRHDELLTKWRYSAFVGTDLRDKLADQGRDQIVLCGIYAHIGVLMTACDAFMHEIQPFLVSDAVADFSDDDHWMAVNYASRRCAVATATGAVVDALSCRVPA